MSDHQLPTREATATVYCIEGSLLNITTIPGPQKYVVGHAYVTARIDTDGATYRWRVEDARKYAIGDTITVTVPA